MNWRKWLGIETRSAEVTPSDEELELLLKGRIFGTKVTRSEAISIPAVASGVYMIASIVAGLPIKLYKVVDDRVEEVVGDNRTRLLNVETNSILSTFETKVAMINDLLLEGNCYCYIGKEGNKAIDLQYLPKSSVAIIDNGRRINREVYYVVDGTIYDDFNIMSAVRNSHNGVRGRGLIDDNSVLLSTMYNALCYENGAMSKGGKKGFLKSERKLTKEMMDELKKGWKQLYSNNNSDVIVLNNGVDFQNADSTATENQLNENKQTNTELLYKILGFTEDTFTNEEAFRVFVKTAIVPIVACLTQAINRSLLLEAEKGTYYFRFDLNDLLKADMLSRYQAYKTAIEANWIKIDEIRKLEDMEPLGIDFLGLNLANVLYYPDDKTIYTPNTGQFGDLKKGGEGNEGRGAERSSGD